jgi:hypothetical protein
MGQFHEYPATAGYFLQQKGGHTYEYMDEEHSDECMDDTRVHGRGT